MARIENVRGARRQPQEKSGANRLVELVVIVVIALALAFVVQLLIVKTYRIPSGSMEPTLDIGQRVLVNRIGMHFGDPSIGDIVVFHPPKGADSPQALCGAPDEGGGSIKPCSKETAGTSSQTFIKRVVGLGGDRISIRGGHVIRNGRLQRERFTAACGSDGIGCDFAGTITVPQGSFYMMGDNRGASDDSRYWGPVKKDQLIGTAIATYWPPNRIGVF